MNFLHRTSRALRLAIGLVAVASSGATVRAADAKTNSTAWAFHPLAEVRVPAEFGAHPVDAFLNRTLKQKGLKAAKETDRATLIRRMSFDLVGLPPTPAEVEAFVADKAPDAVERLAKRLLASRGHGERWARHWLDVVRFGESQGFEYDRIRENAWRYRDYVIDSLNADKPYDQFVREQLAGDVLQAATQESIAATGFLVGGPWDQVGHGSASAKERAITREAEMEDMVGTVAQTFLGITLNCARCHDHKFDPMPQRDYYRVKSVFDGVRHGERSILPAAEQAARDAEKAALAGRIGAIDQRLAELASAARSRVVATLRSNGLPSIALPMAVWTFEDEAADQFGGLAGSLEGKARIEGGRLHLDGKAAFLKTPELKVALGEKTLEAWVTIATLDQRGGGILTIEMPDGRFFDALVYGERQPKRWMVGSEFHRRTLDLNGPEETASPNDLVHIAAVYRADRTIQFFRNGQPYGDAYVPKDEFGRFNTFPAGSRILIGKRHTGGGNAFFKGTVDEARIYDRALTVAEVAASFRAGPGAFPVQRKDLTRTYTEAEAAERTKLEGERANVVRQQSALQPTPRAYAANPQQPPVTTIFARGEADKPRAKVSPGALSALALPAPELGLAEDAAEAERRLKFAAWVTHPDNPLTSRTIVNRVWQHHFGRGLVGTPNDFGQMGERPSHPELLDWLARWFVARDGANWSLKKLHLLLVTSDAYRRSSEATALKDNLRVDAENRLLWRFTPRRLEAEAVRDALLFLAGSLAESRGGPGFRPFIHKTNGGQDEYFPADLIGAEYNRRTVYRIGVHSGRDPLLDSLDCPEFTTRTPVRASTTTPLQALALMNDSFVLRQTEQLGAAILAEVGADPARQVERLWLRGLGRLPRRDEAKSAVKVAREHGIAAVAWALVNSGEFLHVK